MNATGHSCKVGDRQSTYLIDKIELESQGAMKNEFSCSKMIIKHCIFQPFNVKNCIYVS